MKTWLFGCSALFMACGAQERFVYSPAEPNSTLVAILDIDGEPPQIRQGTAQDALRLELEPGVGRLFLAAYGSDRRAQDGSLVSDCTLELQGDAPQFVEPDEVFATVDFDTEGDLPDWAEATLPGRLTIRNQDCQQEIDPCSGILTQIIELPPEYNYTAMGSHLPDTVILGGEVERGQNDDPIALRVENGTTATVAVPQLGQGYVNAILPLSETNWMGITGYQGRLWQTNPQDGTSQLSELYAGSDIKGVEGGPVLVRTEDSAFLANPVRELNIPESEPWVQDIFVSPDVAYLSTGRNLYRVEGETLVPEVLPVVLTDRLHYGGDSELIVGVGTLQEIIERDLPNGTWRRRSRPFEQFERFYTVTGAGRGRYVIGGSSMLAVYTERGFCRLEYPLREFKKLTHTRDGVVYAHGTETTELIRLELPLPDR